ncbi:unnamed protein product [Rhodiola kirilowii]
MLTRSKNKEKVNASFDQTLQQYLDLEKAKGQGTRNKGQPRRQGPPPMAQLPNEEPNGEKPLKDYSTPRLTGFQSPIAPPGVNAPHFELKPALINMVGNNAFTGIGNPNAHLPSFLELCETFKMNNVPKENIYLRLFPFSLTGKAKDWLWSHAGNIFTTWDELAQAFLLQYFPPAKTQRLKNLINSFTQGEDETFHEAWERFKELQRECPRHNIDKPTLIQIFYQGMDADSKRQMDQAVGGAFMELHPPQGGYIIDKIARNSHLWGGERTYTPKKQGKSREVDEVDPREDVRALNKKIDALATSLSALHVNQSQKQPRVCAICTSPSHVEYECPHTFPPEKMENKEEVNFLQRNQASYGRDQDILTFRTKQPSQSSMIPIGVKRTMLIPVSPQRTKITKGKGKGIKGKPIKANQANLNNNLKSNNLQWKAPL